MKNLKHAPVCGDCLLQGGLTYDIDVPDALWAELLADWEDRAQQVIVDTIALSRKCGTSITEYSGVDAERIVRECTVNDWRIVR